MRRKVARAAAIVLGIGLMYDGAPSGRIAPMSIMPIVTKYGDDTAPITSMRTGGYSSVRWGNP
jgi:hypothetical protein